MAQGMKLSERLAEVRREKGVSYRALTERCGIPTPTLNRWELGAQCPNLDHLEKIAAAFDMTVLEFLEPLYSRERTTGKIQEAMRLEAERRRVIEDRTFGPMHPEPIPKIVSVCSNCGSPWDDPTVTHSEFGCSG